MKYSGLVTLFFFLVAPAILHAQDSQGGKTSADRGKLIFEQTCLACHQADGAGVPQLAPPLVKGTFVNGDKAKLIGIVLHGLENVEINGEYYSNPMPSFDYLSDQDIADVLTYVRSNFSNSASAITSEEVTSARKDNTQK
jgi:mono/diheme cytochrome c family protein